MHWSLAYFVQRLATGQLWYWVLQASTPKVLPLELVAVKVFLYFQSAT